MRWTCFWSCTYLSCPTSILVSCRGIGSSRSIPNPREQRREQSPAPKAGLVFLTGSAHPQQVPNPQLHPQTCPRMRPEHGSGWVHPLACPQGAHRVTPSVVGSAGSPRAQEHPHGSPRRDTDTKKTLHHQPGGCERWSNRDTSNHDPAPSLLFSVLRHLPRSVLVPLPSPSPYSLILSRNLFHWWQSDWQGWPGERLPWSWEGGVVAEQNKHKTVQQRSPETNKMSHRPAAKQWADDQPNYNRLLENSTLMLFFFSC